ncbi:MAG: hypothetical protein QI197_06535 [Candidatus Korarchaeota archaeon]|nr:hypothetical protein [Candidatus Korarchaeota archaeon]
MIGIDLTGFLKELLIRLANWMDSLVKDTLLPLLTKVGMSEPVAGAAVTIIELLVLVTLIAKISGIIRWILVVVLALLLLGTFLPAS